MVAALVGAFGDVRLGSADEPLVAVDFAELGVEGVAVTDVPLDGRDDGVALGDGSDVGDGFVAVGDVLRAGAPATVRVVAHGWPAEHVEPAGAAAVVSFVPAGASAATVALNDVLAARPEGPCAPAGRSVQVSCPVFASRARPCFERSALDVATVAFASRPERSSTTVAPGAGGC